MHGRSHDICVFSDRDAGIAFALSFLGYGLEHNESIILIQDYLEKNLMLSMMKKVWGDVFIQNMERGNISLFGTAEWYFPDGSQNFDSSHVNHRWSEQVADSLKNGNTGLRCFAETKSFFDLNLKKELIDYEATIGKSPQLPFRAVCSYARHNISSLERDEYRKLLRHHRRINFIG